MSFYNRDAIDELVEGPITVEREREWLRDKRTAVRYAIASAKSVLSIFEREAPGDKHPRILIKAATRWLSTGQDITSIVNSCEAFGDRVGSGEMGISAEATLAAGAALSCGYAATSDITMYPFYAELSAANARCALGEASGGRVRQLRLLRNIAREEKL